MNAPNALVAALFDVILVLLNLYMWILIIGAVLSWLIALNVVNRGNRFVQVVGDFCFRMTEPLLKPLRSKLPPMGGLDLSWLVLFLIIMFLQHFIWRLAI